MSSNALCEKIRERIRKSDLWGAKSKETSTKFSGLRCPECGRDAWAYVEAPFVVICNHKNACGARVKTLELFPELKVNIEREFAPTKTDPHRPAREYLHSRGLDRSLKGVHFQYWPNIRGLPSGGVMFKIGKNSDGVTVWNGRIFNPPPGEDKAHNKGGTAGLFWKHPTFPYDPDQPTYVTEAVIEGMSMIEMGCQAVSILSAGQDPSKIDLGDLARNMVMALNGDEAGVEGMKKWKAHFPHARAIAPLSGDWNDFLDRHSAAKAEAAFKLSLPRLEAQARILQAEDAQSYAEIYHEVNQRAPGLFSFGQVYHYGSAKQNGKFTEVKARRISDFTLKVEYYEEDTTNSDGSVFRSCVNVKRKGHRPRRFMLNATELSTPGTIRKAILERSLASWDGGEWETKALANLITHTEAPIVRQLYRIGHDEESDTYVFPSFLIDKSGRLVLPDPKGFFRLSSRDFIGPSKQKKCLSPRKGDVSARRLYELMELAWPGSGGLIFAFTTASWWVTAVKRELGFFPFCSLWGETQTGKSKLVTIANALQCIDDEGLPLTKVNTAKGEMRKLAQRSGLVQALIEANREENTRFDFDVLLPMYNYGNPIRVTAVKTNDLQTQETPFLASLLFAQNREQFKTKAQMERVISSRKMLNDDINSHTREAFDALMKIPLREMAWTFVEIMNHRKIIEESWIKEFFRARSELMAEIPDNRIAENHAIILAFHRIITRIIGVEHDIFPYMVEIASLKQEKCRHREATPADHFFEVLDGMSTEDGYEKLAEEKDQMLYLRMADVLAKMKRKEAGFVVGLLYQDLKEHPAFVKSNVMYRGYFGGTFSFPTKVWKFDIRKL